jgi:C4-dicarboxylate transporter DctQ subunit
MQMRATQSIKKSIGWLDENFENVFMFIAYFTIMALMAGSVVQRFIFRTQISWSISICVFLFVWLSWLGASYNTKMRTHLRLAELRNKFPYKAQFACLILDNLLWIGMAIIVGYYAWQQMMLQYDMGSIVYGSTYIPLWPATLSIPASWALLVFRAIQNMVEDIKDFRHKKPLKMEGQIPEVQE